MADIVITPPRRVRSVNDIDYSLTFDDHEGRIVIDFSSMLSIGPVGVVSLIAVLRQGGGKTIGFKLRHDSQVSVYLRQVGAFDVLREFGTFSDPQPEDIIADKLPVRPMLPCAHFHNDADVDRLAGEMQDRFSKELTGLSGLLQPCHEIFSELAGNVVAHAESDGGYVLAQEYHFSSGRVVEIAVADCGIGIRQSLRKNPSLEDFDSDCDAMEAALKEGVTSFQDKYRGYGLAFVADNVNKVKNRRMTMRSGNGILSLRGDGAIVHQLRSTSFSGTIVNVRVPC